MARRKKKQTSLLAGLVGMIGAAYIILTGDFDIATAFNFDKSNNSVTTEKQVYPANGTIDVYFLDVGQADSILIRTEDENMLIDAGNNADGKKLVQYFNDLGIKDFSYVVGTHAHEDHIGGMDNIIDAFNIKTFYMPDAITTSATFEDVLDALDKKNIKFETPEIDTTFNLGNIVFTCLFTGTDTSNLNNTSIVLMMQYGSNKVLFMGDATSEVENKILDKNIEADVLKVGHHGSEYSTSDTFLAKVNPKYAVIEVGKKNIYHHPKQEIISKLEAKQVKIYRTDTDGTIKMSSDGTKITFEKLEVNLNG